MVNKAKKIWLDGKLINWDDANVHILTHSLHYGLGVFEGIRCYECTDGRSAVFRLDDHIARLYASAKVAQMTIPFTTQEFTDALIDTIKVNELRSCYIRPIIFIGDGPMGLFVEEYSVRCSIAVWAWGAYLGEDGIKNGIRAKISSFTRLHVNVNMPKAKITGNYVNSIFAKKEAKECGYDEAILLDAEGYVSEASGENLFIVSKGIIKTPPVHSILDGITRESIIRIAMDKGYTVKEEKLTRDELYIADEVFLTGTAAELTPIRDIDNRTIGEGRPGRMTKDIQDSYFAVVKGENKAYESWLTYLK